jgi:hypothetical protein
LRRIATQVFNEKGSVKRRVSPEFHMPNRTAKFVSVLFVSLIAGAPFVTASHSAPAPDEAEKCLAGPKGTPPQGGHWYYRVERGTKRHCWYIGDEKEKVARAAPATSSASADSASPTPPPKNAVAQRTVADARAELQVPQMQVEPETSNTGQRAVAPAANTAGTDTNQRANVWDTNTQSSVIASRWPESSGVSPSASPAPTPAPAPATYQSAATVQPDAAAAPAPAIAPVTLAAADSSAAKQTGSIQTLLIVVIGALSLAGLIGSAILRFGSMRWPGGLDISSDRGDRRAIWDSVSASPMAYPRSGEPMPTADIPRETRLTPRETRVITRETRAPDDPNQRITEMLARLSRTAAS